MLKNDTATLKVGGPDMPESPDFKSCRYAARQFIGGEGAPGALEGVRGNDLVRFDPRSGYFGTRSSSGVIRTFFRPDAGGAYYLEQLQ